MKYTAKLLKLISEYSKGSRIQNQYYNINFYIPQLMLRSVVSCDWVPGGQEEKDCRELRGGDGYVHYLDCGDDFIGVHICPKLYTLICRFFLPIIPQ